jgi:LmbE family N-acetylglucosaminyl deacetylase
MNKGIIYEKKLSIHTPTKKNNIIFVGPHPDDIELSCGGTVAQFVKLGYNVLCVYLTEGQHSADCYQRKGESINACLSLGVHRDNIIFGPFHDTDIPMSFKTIDYLDQFYLKNIGNIHSVFIPGNSDKHQDHRTTSWCGLSAFRHVPRLFTYETPSSTSEFSPTTFVDISRFLKKKWRVLQCHKSQIRQKKIFMEYEAMISLAAFRGHQAGVRYAEAYQAIKNLLF